MLARQQAAMQQAIQLDKQQLPQQQPLPMQQRTLPPGALLPDNTAQGPGGIAGWLSTWTVSPTSAPAPAQAAGSPAAVIISSATLPPPPPARVIVPGGHVAATVGAAPAWQQQPAPTVLSPTARSMGSPAAVLSPNAAGSLSPRAAGVAARLSPRPADVASYLSPRPADVAAQLSPQSMMAMQGTPLRPNTYAAGMLGSPRGQYVSHGVAGMGMPTGMVHAPAFMQPAAGGYAAQPTSPQRAGVYAAPAAGGYLQPQTAPFMHMQAPLMQSHGLTPPTGLAHMVPGLVPKPGMLHGAPPPYHSMPAAACGVYRMPQGCPAPRAASTPQ